MTDVNSTIKNEIDSQDVVVFMKGTPQMPQCGFSGQVVQILTHLGEPLEPPPVSPARGPPTDWGELVQVHDDRAIFQPSPVELPDIDIHSL